MSCSCGYCGRKCYPPCDWEEWNVLAQQMGTAYPSCLIP